MAFNKSQLKQGTRVEAEHKDVLNWVEKWVKKNDDKPLPRRKIYQQIAKTHLKEDPNYYKKLKKMEAKK